MQTITIPVNSTPPSFSEARRKAVGKAKEVLSDPVIVAWKDEQSQRSGPEIPGGSEDRWHDYGESNAGKLELNVGDTYHFIFTEAADFDEPDLNVASVPDDDGSSILCLNDACTDEDRERMGYFPGGGIGG